MSIFLEAYRSMYKEELQEKLSAKQIDDLRKAYAPLKGKKIVPGPLMKTFDKIDKDKDALVQLYKADIPFVSQMAVSRMILKHDMKAAEINKLRENLNLQETDPVLNEEAELDEAINKEAMNPKQQAAIAISKKEKGEKPKDEKDEGNAFTKALMSAKEKGDKTFTISGKEYSVKEELAKLEETNKNDKSDDGDGLDAVQPKAVKKKFKDRKDKDIDNDGDVDSSDKFLHRKRKAISKAIKKDKKPEQLKAPDESNKSKVDTKPELDEAEGSSSMIKKAGKSIGTAIKRRVTTSGRADRLSDKAKSLEKKVKDRDRLKKAKERIAKAKANLSGKKPDMTKKEGMNYLSPEKKKQIKAEIDAKLAKKDDYFKEKYGIRAEKVKAETAKKLFMSACARASGGGSNRTSDAVTSS